MLVGSAHLCFVSRTPPRAAFVYRATKMPRLGDDTNMATAYPDRASTNLRGSWVRQALMTMAATFILYKVVFTDYKSATKVSMAEKGLPETAQEAIIPKTPWEKAREEKLKKLEATKKLKYMLDEVRNLTLAVNELQQLVPEGTNLQYPIDTTDPDGDGEEGKTQDGDGEGGGDPTQQDGEGGDEGGVRPGGMLRGADEGAGNPDGDGDGGSGGSGDSANQAGTADGAGGRRLLENSARNEREKRTTGEGEEGRAAAAAARYNRATGEAGSGPVQEGGKGRV